MEKTQSQQEKARPGPHLMGLVGPKKFDLPPGLHRIKQGYRGQGYLRAHAIVKKAANKQGLLRPE